MRKRLRGDLPSDYGRHRRLVAHTIIGWYGRQNADQWHPQNGKKKTTYVLPGKTFLSHRFTHSSTLRFTCSELSNSTNRRGEYLSTHNFDGGLRCVVSH